jgi:hypothetical protein
MDLWALMEELEKCSEDASCLDENRKPVKVQIKGGQVLEVTGIAWDGETETVTLLVS